MEDLRIDTFDTFEGEAQTLLLITQRILSAMYSGDAEAYTALVSEDVSAFEPHIAPYRMDGLPFHLDMIASGAAGKPSRLDILTPRVQVYGDCGVVTYTLLKTFLSDGAPAVFQRMNEARIFAKIEGNWKMVHLHKSPAE
jgi:ketosteroid isomerase-like protein